MARPNWERNFCSAGIAFVLFFSVGAVIPGGGDVGERRLLGAGR
jgi:hypothetical protein